MKKNWTKIAIALGPVIVIASVVWEYARTNSSYGFVVTPWAMRGYELDQGQIFVVASVLALVAGLATTWERATRPAVAAAITAFIVIAATVFTAFYGSRTITINLTVFANAVFSFIIAASVSLSLRSLFGERIRFFKRALPVGFALFVIFLGIFHVTILGVEATFTTWIVVFVVFLLFAGLALSIQPTAMAANRMLILVSIALWSLVVFSAGAVREALIQTQSETVQAGGVVGISAQYKDTQAALGWWVAGFGCTVMFIGAVGLWAKRRDVIAAIQRARKQRAAAEKSAKEITDAAEVYAQEQAAAASSSQ